MCWVVSKEWSINHFWFCTSRFGLAYLIVFHPKEDQGPFMPWSLNTFNLIFKMFMISFVLCILFFRAWNIFIILSIMNLIVVFYLECLIQRNTQVDFQNKILTIHIERRPFSWNNLNGNLCVKNSKNPWKSTFYT